MLRTTIIIFLLSLFATAKAQQTRVFSEDQVKFPAELYDFFAETDKKEAKELREQFDPVWLGSYFEETDRKWIYGLANAMIKKRLTAFPAFKNLVVALMGFANKNQPHDSFNGWKNTIDKLLANKKVSTAQFGDFLELTGNLLNTNTIYSEGAVKWYSSTGNFTFQYDSVPKVIFSSTNLIGKSKDDSTVIFGTSGTFYPLKYKWEGKNGQVTWERAGIKKEEAYAELKTYNFVVKSAKFNADSVTMYYKKYFDKPILGSLEERVIADVSEDRASFPKFKSYKSEFEIKNIAPDVNYLGGITISGAKLLGSGAGDQMAQFTFVRDKKKFLVVRAKTLSIKEDRFDAKVASVTFYFDTDSIYHPGVNFKYLVKTRELALVREREASGFSPYFNTFHKLDMYFEALYWKTDEPIIELRPLKGTNEGDANFESANFYEQKRFSDIQGMDPQNPLIIIRNFIVQRNNNEKSFQAGALAQYWKMDATQVRQMLMRLANMGFLLYDIEAEKATVKDKLQEYINAKNGKTDYDVLQFFSVSKNSNNATINLLNYDLKIMGVERIFLSDSQRVVIFPKDKEVIVKRNRDFNFSGIIVAGNFELYGKEFDFNYDKFKLNLPNIDSTKIRVAVGEKDEYGNQKTVRLKSQIENINGELLIDQAYNKSGLKPFSQYPIFKSNKNSFVYYDRKYIEKGVYKRDNFYFKLDPFTLDSLDNFDPKALELDGTFASGGVFADMREKLKVQPDLSLGFTRMTGPSGMSVYEGKAQFLDTLTLSNGGLKGLGRLVYLSSTAESSDFMFYPDSMNAHARKYDMLKSVKEGAEFPDIKAQDVYIHWNTKKENSFYVSNTTKPLLLYNEESKLKGQIQVGKAGVKGKGSMDLASAQLDSKEFKFKKDDFKSDSLDFKLSSMKDGATNSDDKEVAFSTANVKADVSMNSREGKFKSNSKDSYVDFPINHYVCYMDEMRWNMDKDEVDLNSTIKNVDLLGAKFVSTDPAQDSLTFIAAQAKFNLKEKTINCSKVPYIDVADARVYPNNGAVRILKSGMIEDLTEAKVEANRDSKYYFIYNSGIKIYSRKAYTGTGMVDYIDQSGKKQPITLTSIGVEASTLVTKAYGEIPETANFTLSPAFDYKGAVNFAANNPNMVFTGGARMKHTCDKLDRYWLKFSSSIDPKDVYIPVDSMPMSLDGDKLSTGLILVKDSTHVYPAILSKKFRSGDIDIISAQGFVTYDNASGQYQIGSKEKLANSNIPGQYITLSNKSCEVFGEGEMNFGTDYGRVTMQVVGDVTNSVATEKTEFDVVVTLDFYLPPDALKQLNTIIPTYGTLPPASQNTEKFKKALPYLVKDRKDAERASGDITSGGAIRKTPDEFKKMFVFSDLKMEWNSTSRSYVSKGPLSIAYIGGETVNKQFKGYVEFVKKRGGDVFNIYIELDGANWYYFYYAMGELQVLSGNSAFNEAVKAVDPEKRSLDTKNGEKPYRFNLGTDRKKKDFVNRMQGLE